MALSPSEVPSSHSSETHLPQSPRDWLHPDGRCQHISRHTSHTWVGMYVDLLPTHTHAGTQTDKVHHAQDGEGTTQPYRHKTRTPAQAEVTTTHAETSAGTGAHPLPWHGPESQGAGEVGPALAISFPAGDSGTRAQREGQEAGVLKDVTMLSRIPPQDSGACLPPRPLCIPRPRIKKSQRCHLPQTLECPRPAAPRSAK